MPYDEKKSKSELIAELKAEREQVELLEQGLFALRREIARDTDCLERMQKDLERYETIVSSTPDGISLLDSRYRYIIVNEAYEKFSGMKAEELRGRTIAEYLGDEIFREYIKPYFDECLQGKVVQYQQGFDFPGLGRRYVEMSYYPYINARNEIAGVVANTRDITEQRVIEEKISYSERMYRLLAENTVDCIWSMDLNFIFSYVNPAIYYLTGQRAEEWIGTSVYDHFEGERLENIGNQINEAFQRIPDETRISFETYLLDTNGAAVDVEINGRILLDECQNPIEIQGVTRNITERKRMEERLRRNEQFLNSVLESVQDGMSVIDTDLNVCRANSVMRQWAVSIEPPEGRKCYEAYRGLPQPCSPCCAQECLRSGKTEYAEFSGPPGALAQWIEVASHPMSNPETGRVEYVVEFVRDVTQRKQAEEALRDSEAKFRLLAENSADVIWTSDLDGSYTFVSPSVWRVFGYTQQQALKGCFFDHLAAADAECVRDYVKKAICEDTGRREQETVFRTELRQVRRDGSLFWTEVLASPLRDDSGRIAGFQGATRDITDRKRVEEKLLETKERFDVALQVTNTGLWDWNVRTGDVVFNEPWAAMVGYSLEELEPLSIRTWMNLCHPKDLEVSNALVKQHLDGETEIYQCEARMRHKQGGWIWILDQGKVIERDESGLPLRMIGTHTDITERKRMEERLRQMSLYDSLTGLYNRTYFEEEMRRLSNWRYLPMGIIVCDVNGLKLINDTMGHEKGDDLLKVCARTLWHCFRDSDIIARIGGDEFAVLLPQSGPEAVQHGCERIRREAARYREWSPELGLSISLGCAVKEQAPLDMDVLFKQADDAMYKEKLQQSHSSRSETVQALIKTLEARDYITEGHAGRLHEYAQQLGRSLGLSEERLNDLQLLARFHDLGKVGVPDRILFKPGRLTEEEFREMKRHCEIGHRIALSLTDLAPIADYILKHHEHWDGRGYPLGISGEEIPLECRILSIVDAYDAMTSARPYKDPMTYEEAIAELKRCAGSQFDPHLVKRFVRIMSEIRGE